MRRKAERKKIKDAPPEGGGFDTPYRHSSHADDDAPFSETGLRVRLRGSDHSNDRGGSMTTPPTLSDSKRQRIDSEQQQQQSPAPTHDTDAADVLIAAYCKAQVRLNTLSALTSHHCSPHISVTSASTRGRKLLALLV